MNICLQIQNLSKDFSGLKALSGINLDIREGERHAIIGPNGSGKSTLFNVITGKYSPSHGCITFNGEEITRLSPFKINRKGMSRSFQINNFFENMTVYENIRSAILANNRCFFNVISRLSTMNRIKEETISIIKGINLLNCMNTLASELSYGDQRALEIGITICGDPKLVLLDEPTAGMSSDETKKTVKLIRDVTAERTLVIVEHDMEVVFAIADRITVLSRGQVLVTDIPERIRSDKKVKEIYLGEDNGGTAIRS